MTPDPQFVEGSDPRSTNSEIVSFQFAWFRKKYCIWILQYCVWISSGLSSLMSGWIVCHERAVNLVDSYHFLRWLSRACARFLMAPVPNQNKSKYNNKKFTIHTKFTINAKRFKHTIEIQLQLRSALSPFLSPLLLSNSAPPPSCSDVDFLRFVVIVLAWARYVQVLHLNGPWDSLRWVFLGDRAWQSVLRDVCPWHFFWCFANWAHPLDDHGHWAIIFGFSFAQSESD